jgi:salicylate hydroxylase
MAARTLDISIIGAGLGGLVCARALQVLGFAPRVYEQAQALGEVGAGVTMTPNAVKALRFCGLEAPLLAAADEPPVQETRHFATDETLFGFDRAGTPALYGAPYLMLHRADLHALLVDAVRGHDPDAIRLGVRANGAARDGRATLSDGSQIKADVLIGADGVRSPLREAAFGPDAPRFTGHMAFRAMVPGAAAPTEALVPGSVVWTAPGRSFVRYPVRHGALVNCVGLARAPDWTVESWSNRVSRAAFAAAFEGFCAPVQDLIAAAPDDAIAAWGLFVRPALPAFHAGRIALLGDAAHPMLPFMGQGAAMALEDGVVLARCLAAADDVDAALARYSAARVARATLVQTESALGADRIQALDPDKLRGAPPKGEDALGLFHYDPGLEPV